MKIPKKIKVGGITYKIKNVDVVSVGSSGIGDCDYDNSVIEIRNGLGIQQREQTFLHELLHAIFFHCDLEQDEHKIELLTQALHMVINDNPKIFNQKI